MGSLQPLLTALELLIWETWREWVAERRSRREREYEEYGEMCREYARTHAALAIPVAHGSNLIFRLPSASRRRARREQRGLARGARRA